MRVLVTWGSKRGGTAGIGGMIADTLAASGYDVVAAPVERVTSLDGFSAVIIGGALYANVWPWKARHFIHRNRAALCKVPVWMFSSGPLDASADERDIPATRAVSILAERIGAQGHMTFGGRLDPEAKGFPASAMAKTHSGDWRSPDRIHAWAAHIAAVLPSATPGSPVEQSAHSLLSLVAPPAAGWALCAALMVLLLNTLPVLAALVIHAIAAPLIFSAVALLYFRNRGAREPLPTAIAWTSIVMALDAVVISGVVQHSFAMFASVAGSWLPFALIFAAVWGTGYVMLMRPDARESATRAIVER
jgi:menaquinone-dependent protoporphyrinogen oxidase